MRSSRARGLRFCRVHQTVKTTPAVAAKIADEARTVERLLDELAAMEREMGPVETKMLEYIKRRLDEGALAVSESEIMAAVVGDNPKLRNRPAYKYGLRRLHVRHVINAVNDPAGETHYFIGSYPSEELRRSLGLATQS